MSAHIVNSILAQINQQPNPANIKKLLYLKLETELSSSRCVFNEQLQKENKELNDATEINVEEA